MPGVDLSSTIFKLNKYVKTAVMKKDAVDNIFNSRPTVKQLLNKNITKKGAAFESLVTVKKGSAFEYSYTSPNYSVVEVDPFSLATYTFKDFGVPLVARYSELQKMKNNDDAIIDYAMGIRNVAMETLADSIEAMFYGSNPQQFANPMNSYFTIADDTSTVGNINPTTVPAWKGYTVDAYDDWTLTSYSSLYSGDALARLISHVILTTSDAAKGEESTVVAVPQLMFEALQEMYARDSNIVKDATDNMILNWGVNTYSINGVPVTMNKNMQGGFIAIPNFDYLDLVLQSGLNFDYQEMVKEPRSDFMFGSILLTCELGCWQRRREGAIISLPTSRS